MDLVNFQVKVSVHTIFDVLDKRPNALAWFVKASYLSWSGGTLRWEEEEYRIRSWLLMCSPIC